MRSAKMTHPPVNVFAASPGFKHWCRYWGEAASRPGSCKDLCTKRFRAKILAKWLDPIDYGRAAFHWSYRYHKHGQPRATDSLHHIRSPARDQFRQTKSGIHTACSITIPPNSCVFACASFQPLCCYPSNHPSISCPTTSRACRRLESPRTLFLICYCHVVANRE